MTGRGVDQILPFPSNPALRETYVESARDYLAMAERANGTISKPVSFSYLWGDALAELDRLAPRARIINLETSITTSDDFEPKGINYRMHPGNTPCLTAAGVSCCVLANNHVLDWGRSGLIETICCVRKAGIKTAGAGADLAEASAPAAIELGGRSRLLVFAAGLKDSGIDDCWAAAASTPGVMLLSDLSDSTVTRLAEQVTCVRQPDDVVVFSIHWGENWGYHIPQRQRTFARKLIDLARVDVVQGHSSHHPKAIEVYKSRPILYGCGDFINDYEGIAGYEEFRGHLVLAYFLRLDRSTGSLLSLEMAPFEIKRFRLQRADSRDAAWLRDVMTREGRRLGSRADLDLRNNLVLTWQESS